jgi:hypothetical protein
MGRALMEALRSVGLINDPERQIGIHTEGESDGGITVATSGGTLYEQSLFAESMGEILGPVGNPRYIITRQGKSEKEAQDCHSVPTCLGGHKDRAEAARWAGRPDLHSEGGRCCSQRGPERFLGPSKTTGYGGSIGGSEVGRLIVRPEVLRVESVHEPRERDHLTDVVAPGDPPYGTLEPKAESRVRKGAKAP